MLRKFIILSLFFSNSSHAYNNGYLYPRNKKLTIDSTLLGKCFSQVIQKHFEKSKLKINQHKSDYPKLIEYLIGDRETDYSTGHESELHDWVLKHKDNSIDPLVLFEQSLIINNGDIFNAILTINQLLRNEARYYKDYSRYVSSRVLKKEFFNKFIDIRGDLEERAGGTGDHSGSWYRIWATMLNYLSIIEIEDSIIPGQEAGVCGQKFKSLTVALAKGFGISSLAEWVKYPISILPGESWIEKDKRKSEIKRIGYITAHSMIKSISDNTSNSSQNFSCTPTTYLIEDSQK